MVGAAVARVASVTGTRAANAVVVARSRTAKAIIVIRFKRLLLALEKMAAIREVEGDPLANFAAGVACAWPVRELINS